MRLAALAIAIAACGDNRAGPDAAPAADALAADAAASSDAAGWVCNGTTGLATPELPCSPAHPCGAQITPFVTPACKTTVAGRATFDDSPPRAWTDAVTGDPRAACVFRPADAAVHPLVMFFH